MWTNFHRIYFFITQHRGRSQRTSCEKTNFLTPPPTLCHISAIQRLYAASCRPNPPTSPGAWPLFRRAPYDKPEYIIFWFQQIKKIFFRLNFINISKSYRMFVTLRTSKFLLIQALQPNFCFFIFPVISNLIESFRRRIDGTNWKYWAFALFRSFKV